MKIELKTSESELNKMLEEAQNEIHEEIIKTLSYLGERAVIEAKNRSYEESWIDQTGNLRSSIGFVVVHNGEVKNISTFDTIKGGADGSKTGKAFAEELAQKFSSGYVLIVVAGMEYAAYVEAMENKCVLASAEIFVKQELPKMIDKLSEKFAKKV